MILLISPSTTVSDCASLIEERLQTPAASVKTLEEGCERLKSQGFSAVVLDEWECELAPQKTEYLLQFVKGAIPVFVDFSITSAERLLRVVKTALSRRELELKLAREAESARLLQELNNELTTVMLLCTRPVEQSDRDNRDRLRKIEEVTVGIAGRLSASYGARAAHH